MLSFAKELLCEMVAEVEPLLRLHFEELATHDRLNPQWDKYAALEQAGCLDVFTARTDDGKLVGYAAIFVMPHLHSGELSAISDVLYLHPEYRRGTTGLKFIEFCENCIMDRGADFLSWHIKVGLDFRPLMHRMGYYDDEYVVTKRLKEKQHG